MKRFFEPVIVFIVLLIVFYLQPVLKSNSNKTQIEMPVINQISSNPKNLTQSVKAAGIASSIGVSQKDIFNQYGKPVRIFSMTDDTEWWLYQDEVDNYFQIKFDKGYVSSIVYIGDDTSISPFYSNMTLGDVSENFPISSVFEFKYQDNVYKIELTEEEMNYRPLVKFDNHTFAMLYFSSKTGMLQSVRYLDIPSLLNLSPYQSLEEYSSLDANVFDESETIDDTLSIQMLSIVNQLRMQSGLKQFEISDELTEVAQNSITVMNNDVNEILKKENLPDFLDIENKQSDSRNPFYLSSEENDRLLKMTDSTAKNIQLFYIRNVIDVPFLAMNWISSSVTEATVLSTSHELIGFAFEEDQVVIALATDKIEENTNR